MSPRYGNPKHGIRTNHRLMFGGALAGREIETRAEKLEGAYMTGVMLARMGRAQETWNPYTPEQDRELYGAVREGMEDGNWKQEG